MIDQTVLVIKRLCNHEIHANFLMRRRPMLSRFIYGLILLMVLYGPQSLAALNGFDAVVDHPAIPLLDETGKHVLDSGKPYSSRMSCGNGEGAGCHDYRKISSAYHFEQGRDEARDDFGQARRLPHLVSPGYFGGYNCMGRNNPGWLAYKNNAGAADFGDFGTAGLLRECAECHAGAGWSEYDRSGQRYDDPTRVAGPDFDGDDFDRQGEHVSPWDWQRSGVMENDCLLCHADLSRLSRFTAKGPQSSGARSAWLDLRNRELAGQGLFRAIDSALWAYLNLRPKQAKGLALLDFVRAGKTANAPLQLHDGQPVLRWNTRAFNGLGKVVIPMRRFPASDNCIVCHKTGADRRGFYGFGGESRPKIRDVHLGKRFTEDNGETRVINNCNACHAQRYFVPRYSNVALDADHDFPKGNGDADVRNDLDGMPGPKSCEHCHDTARYPALPSGQKDIVAAHLQLWRTHGDLDGYAASILEKITRSHLDTVACQTCHINRLTDSRGQELSVHFRFRRGEDQILKIFPYHPATRYYVQDRRSGRVLYRHERDSIFVQKTGADGRTYVAIVDPLTRAETGRALRTPAGDNEPEGYAGFLAMKQACDRLLGAKGYPQADTRLVYVEANRYVISHNTVSSPRSVACNECHDRSANGSFSARLSPQGLLGATRQLTLTQLPDRRLVDEGLVELALPYHRVDDGGRVFKTVGDELYASRFEPSMSVLQAETTRSIQGRFKSRTAAESIALTGIDAVLGRRLQTYLGNGDWLLFNSGVGAASLREVALLSAGEVRQRVLLEDVRVLIDAHPPSAADQAQITRRVPGNVRGERYSLHLTDATGQALTRREDPALLFVLPYTGTASRMAQVSVACSATGEAWTTTPVLDWQPAAEPSRPGRVVVRPDSSCRQWVVLDQKQ
jgi:hypothetical protein